MTTAEENRGKLNKPYKDHLFIKDFLTFSNISHPRGRTETGTGGTHLFKKSPTCVGERLGNYNYKVNSTFACGIANRGKWVNAPHSQKLFRKALRAISKELLNIFVEFLKYQGKKIF